MKQAEALMLEEMPITPVFYGVSRNLVHTWVKGWEGQSPQRPPLALHVIEGRDTAAAAKASDDPGASVAAEQGSGGDRPWYWWLIAAWEWLAGLLCAWFAWPAGRLTLERRAVAVVRDLDQAVQAVPHVKQREDEAEDDGRGHEADEEAYAGPRHGSSSIRPIWAAPVAAKRSWAAMTMTKTSQARPSKM